MRMLTVDGDAPAGSSFLHPGKSSVADTRKKQQPE
jgi:hypothetical protein